MWVEADTRHVPSFNTFSALSGIKPRSPDCGLGFTPEIVFRSVLWPTSLTASCFFCVYHRWLWVVAGAHGDHGSSAPGHVEVEWSSPIGNVLTLCLRMEESTVRDRGFSTSPATHSLVTTLKVRNSETELSFSSLWILKKQGEENII